MHDYSFYEKDRNNNSNILCNVYVIFIYVVCHCLPFFILYSEAYVAQQHMSLITNGRIVGSIPTQEITLMP